MHFICIFLQNNLHMSDKMCIFAADLGIVPSVTIKSLRVMKKECIFKAWGGHVWMRVLRFVNPLTGLIYYRVYMGRCLCEGVPSYDFREDAIDKAIRLAKADALSDEKGGLL